jgi:hypothetical protein
MEMGALKLKQYVWQNSGSWQTLYFLLLALYFLYKVSLIFGALKFGLFRLAELGRLSVSCNAIKNYYLN